MFGRVVSGLLLGVWKHPEQGWTVSSLIDRFDRQCNPFIADRILVDMQGTTGSLKANENSHVDTYLRHETNIIRFHGGYIEPFLGSFLRNYNRVIFE